MAGRELDPDLLGRLATLLDESGNAQKTLQVQVARLSAQLSAQQSELNSAHARVKQLERKVDGNGGNDGLRTNMRLVQQKSDQLDVDVKALETWRQGSGEKKLQKVESQGLADRTLRWSIMLGIGAIIISIMSVVGNCAPSLIKGSAAKTSSSD